MCSGEFLFLAICQRPINHCYDGKFEKVGIEIEMAKTSQVINKFSLKVAQDHATYLPGLVCKYVFGLTPLIFRYFLDLLLGILDYPHWVDQPVAPSHTMRHVLTFL